MAEPTYTKAQVMQLMQAAKAKGYFAQPDPTGGYYDYSQQKQMPESPMSKLGAGVAKYGVKKLKGLFGSSDVASSSSPSMLGSEAPLANVPSVNLDGLGGWTSPGSSEALAAAPEVPGAFSLSGIGSAGNAYLPIAGAFGAYDVLKNKKHGGAGALQGAASGAAMGSYFGPQGALIGAGIGAGVGYFGNMGDKDMYKTEYKKAQALRDKGINWQYNTNAPTHGLSDEELIARAQASGGNVAFAKSRSEADLTPADIKGYSAFGEKFGNDWFGKFNDNQRTKIAQAALDSGAVREHHGTIDIDFNKIDRAKLNAALSGK